MVLRLYLSVCPSVTNRRSIERAEQLELVLAWEFPFCVIRKFGYVQNLGYFPLKLCSKLWAQKISRLVSTKLVDGRAC